MIEGEFYTFIVKNNLKDAENQKEKLYNNYLFNKI